MDPIDGDREGAALMPCLGEMGLPGGETVGLVGVGLDHRSAGLLSRRHTDQPGKGGEHSVSEPAKRALAVGLRLTPPRRRLVVLVVSNPVNCPG